MDMDTTDWLKGIVHEEAGIGSSSSPSGDQMISCSRPPLMVERRLRPQHEQALKCPRCDSNHTKFCYYNNYSLSQPRYFCKTCRRYWTKGGSLRNVPVGGGCRKNKRSGCKKPIDQRPISMFRDGIDLHLSPFSGLPPSHHHLSSLPETPRGLNFMECKYDGMFESSGDVVDGKFGAMLGNPRSNLFTGGGDGCDMGGLGSFGSSSFHGMSPMEFSSMDGNINHGGFMEINCQRLGAVPFEGQYDGRNNYAGEMKPGGNKLLTLEWQEQGCGEIGRDSFGYSNGMGLWTGLMNGHGSSTTNPLI